MPPFLKIIFVQSFEIYVNFVWFSSFAAQETYSPDSKLHPDNEEYSRWSHAWMNPVLFLNLYS